tara:strand:+ start:152 stop:409 length:258 start_codon:yes stop_codon:yes gene_type:complete
MTYYETEKEKRGMWKYHAGKQMTEENNNWVCVKKIYMETNAGFKKQWVLHHQEYGIILQENTEAELIQNMMWYTLHFAEGNNGCL